MLIRDMLHSCSHEGVAQAAVACIGDPFADRVRAAARRRGVGVGVGSFVAGVVREYARQASESDLARLRRSIAGTDQPILVALRCVVEQALQDLAPRPRPPSALRRIRAQRSYEWRRLINSPRPRGARLKAHQHRAIPRLARDVSIEALLFLEASCA